MTIVRSLGVLTLAMLLGLVATGSAAAAKYPLGSYLDSCGTVSARNDILRAHCQRSHGRARTWARLDHYSSCVGDISNRGGQLTCLRQRDLPRGDWSASCIRPHVTAAGVFSADCRTPRGGRVASQIALDKCRKGVTSVRGQLACVGGEQMAERREAEPAVPTVPATPPTPPHAAPPAPPAPAHAADDDNDQDVAANVPPPPGPYLNSCRDIDFDGRFLGALCQDARGGWQDSGLDVKGCKHDQVIGAKDGLLVCLRVAGGREPPAGTYRDTCRGVTFDGRFVSGECKDAKGGWLKAMLDMRTCHDGTDMLNDDGEIVCRRPAPPAPPATPAPPAVTPSMPAATAASTAAPTPPPPVMPPTPPSVATQAAPVTPPAPPTPSETASAAAANDDAADAPDGSGAITLWAGYGFNGANKTLTGDAPDLAALGWTDLASSLQVRGVWEVCEKPNYAGNCARIEDDQPNLADIGFNHRIRSLRRAEAKP